MKTFSYKKDWFYPKSLQQRTVMFILLPIFFFLTIAGIIGYRAVREILLEQWSEAALANLERAAHQIDMQLSRPKQVLFLLEELSRKDSIVGIHEFITDRLSRIDGVISVKVNWPEESMASHGIRFMRYGMGWGQEEGYYKSKLMFDITPPVYNVEHDSKTVSMVTDLVDKEGKKVGDIELILDFETLISQTVKSPWWNVYKAYIVDQNGNVLVSAINEKNKIPDEKAELFGNTGTLEQKTFELLRHNISGTVFGEGIPPEEISGFYHLKEAPWTMVIIVPGKKVLQPIIRFRSLYFITAIACIAMLLLFIRIMITKTTRAIKEVSQTASDLARGHFGEPLKVRTRDEVGELIENFNTMTSQLQKGIQLQEAMDIASEVQMTLLPQKDLSGHGIEVSGVSLYCDETGGDYFDFIQSKRHPGRQHVIVGDVVGHGIGAALLMATLRALVRANVDRPGAPEELIARVNQQLCLDTSEFGNFASLFYLRIDADEQELQWVRAGHDPAILYYPETGKFIELTGDGLVLGLDDEYSYQSNSFALTGERLILLIGSDGVWESVNGNNEQFGKQRVRDIIEENAHLAPHDLLGCINESIEQFRGNTALSDDITLVAISIDGSVADLSKKGIH